MSSIQSSRRNGIILTEEKLSILDCTNSTNASVNDTNSYDSDGHNSTSSSPLPLSRGKKAFDFRKSPRKKTDPGSFNLYDLVVKSDRFDKNRVDTGDKGIFPLTHTASKIELHGQSYLYMEVTIDSALEFDLQLKDIRSDVLVERCHYTMIPDGKRINHHNIHITFPAASDYVFSILGKSHNETAFTPRLTYNINGTGANSAARSAACYKMKCSATTHGASKIENPGNTLKMQFRIPEKITLLVDYRYDNREKVPYDPIFQRGDNTNVDVRLCFPKKGGYTLKILGQLQGEYVFRKLFEYTITNATPTTIENLPPKMWSPLNHFPSSIYSPLNGTLAPGNLTRFKLRVKDAVAVKVIGNNTTGQLKRLSETSEIFEGSIVIGEFSSGAVNVMAKFYDHSEDYVLVATYNVVGKEKQLQEAEKNRQERKEIYSNLIKQEVQRKVEVKVEEIKRDEKLVEVSDYLKNNRGSVNSPNLFYLDKEGGHHFDLVIPNATEVCLSYGSQWIKLRQSSSGNWIADRTFKVSCKTDLKIFAQVKEQPGKYKKIAQYCFI